METDPRREAALHTIRASRYVGDALFVELTGESPQVAAALLDEAASSFEAAARCAMDYKPREAHRDSAYPVAEIFAVAANAAFILVGDPEGSEGEDEDDDKQNVRTTAIALRVAAGGCKKLTGEAPDNGA